MLESGGVLDSAHTDRGEFCTGPLEVIYRIAQLRDVLPTKRSPVVPKPRNDRRTVRPEFAESYLGSVRLRKSDVGQKVE